MATTSVIAPRSTRAVTVQVRGGGSRQLPIAPTGFEIDPTANVHLIPRQGQKSITRPDGPNNKSISFETTIARSNWTESVQGDINWLENRAADGKQIKISGMPKQLAGWWYIEDLDIRVTQMNPAHQVSQATVRWSLIEAVDFNASVSRRSPPPKQPTGQKAKQPVYRTHTVVSGDWLSKISQRYLGNMNRWKEIYQLNRSVIGGNPDLIFPGQRFRIPPK